MRHRLAAVVLLGAVALAACGGGSSGPSTAFCAAATRYENELQREATNGKLDTTRQIGIVQQLVTAAPASIKGDAQTFLDALRHVDANPKLRDQPAIKRAVDNVNRFASNKCGLFNQSGGAM